jgi:hypothetical protein
MTSFTSTPRAPVPWLAIKFGHKAVDGDDLEFSTSMLFRSFSFELI